MALDSVANSPFNNSIFRPQPLSTLQNNLAQYYERTSEFVDEQFKELAEAPGESPRRRNAVQESERNENLPRLQPKGMGKLVDIRV